MRKWREGEEKENLLDPLLGDSLQRGSFQRDAGLQSGALQMNRGQPAMDEG